MTCNETWTSQDGRTQALHDMNDYHLLNTLAYVRRTLQGLTGACVRPEEAAYMRSALKREVRRRNLRQEKTLKNGNVILERVR